jgi:hypothetical protein
VGANVRELSYNCELERTGDVLPRLRRKPTERHRVGTFPVSRLYVLNVQSAPRRVSPSGLTDSSGQFAVVTNLATLIALATIRFPSRCLVEALTAFIVREGP